MKKYRVSRNVGGWGDFLFIIGIVGILFGVLITAIYEGPGLLILGASFLSILFGVLLRGISVIAEAAERYIEKSIEEAQKGPEVEG